MGDFNEIRGKKPTKTELILRYLVNRPNKILTPKEVSDGLGFNLQTTVTVLNRLALEGAIAKEGRGKYCYQTQAEGIGIKKGGKAKVSGTEKTVLGTKIDPETAGTIYRAIYNMASESTGADVLGTLIGMGPEDFDSKAPIESIQNLVKSLIDVLGKDMADDIVNIALASGFSGEENAEILNIL